MQFSKQFKQRVVMSAIGIIGLAISIYFSFSPYFKFLFILLNGAVIGLALVEYYHLARNKGFQPSAPFGIGFSVLYLIVLSASLHHPSFSGVPALFLLFSLLVLFLLFFKHQALALGNLAITLFGIGYLTIPLSCALRINYFYPPNSIDDGRLWLAYALITTKMTDIGAYFCGKILGRYKLAPTISPKKTIEGSLGGLGASLIFSVVFALFTSHVAVFKMTFFQSIWIGLSISVLAQIGDLAESLLKRDAGVKDSSHLPGLGGVLDIVDSLVFTLPFVYLLLHMGVIGY